MERLTGRNEMGGAYYPKCFKEPCLGMGECVDMNCEQQYDVCEKLAAYEDTGLTPQEITDGKLLTGWIPVVEKLPEEPSAGLTEMEDLQEYIVMIDGAELPTVLSYAGNSEWYRDGNFYKVLAWMPLPERPEAEMEDIDGRN